jgi:hypothetical protein
LPSHQPPLRRTELRMLALSVDHFHSVFQDASPMPAPDAPATGETLHDLLGSLTTGVPIIEQIENEEWPNVIARLQVEGRIAEVTEEVWYYFLEVLPPKLLRGNWFAFAEGQDPLKLFWRKQGRHYGRQLTWEETHRLCDATGLPKDYGYL